MEGVMFTYGLATISSFICAILSLVSIITSIIRYNSGEDKYVKLGRILIYISIAFASIVFLLTIVLIISRPDSLSNNFGALIKPLSISLIPLIISIFANKQVGNSKKSDSITRTNL